MNWFKKQTLPIHIRGQSKEHSCQVWFNLTPSYQRRWCKCDGWPELWRDGVNVMDEVFTNMWTKQTLKEFLSFIETGKKYV